MACGCSKRATREKPLILGEPTGEPIQAKALITLAGAQAGSTVWVQGSQVDALFDAGWLAPIEETVPA